MILTATDNGDGTGASVTLSGSSGTSTIWLSRFAGTNAQRAFLNVGTIVGNGTLSLPGIASGPYLVTATNGTSAATPVGLRVTDSSKPKHLRCLEAVREFVIALNLPQVSTDPADHLICKLPYRPDLQFDFAGRPDISAAKIVVMYFPRPETAQTADVNHNTVDYGVQVLFIRKIPQKLIEGLPTLLDIREKMLSSLSISPLPDFQCIYDVYVTPGQVVIPDQWVKSYECTTLIVRCLTEVAIGVV